MTGANYSNPTQGWMIDIRHAAVFLTRLPIAFPSEAADRPLARAMRAFPIVGACLGALAGAVYAVLVFIGLPHLASAFTALGVGALLTGALHEDGLADTADGFGGSADVDKKLAIMRDSRIGTFGVIAVVLSFGLRAALIADLSALAGLVALIAAESVSRAAMPVLMQASLPARPDGLGHGAGKPTHLETLTAVCLAAFFAITALGLMAGVAAIFAAGLVTVGVAIMAQRHIGGYTGDVLGATQQIAAIAVLASAWIAP